MRRDVCHFYAAPVDVMYHAYLKALGNDKFDRECREEPYHTLTFGLNFSMKYNFNGGSCVVHFIPYQNGTAVDLRFILAQGAGARYEKYDRELCDAVMAVCGVPALPLELDIDVFMDERNQVTPATFAAAPASDPILAAVPAPTPIPVPVPAAIPVAVPVPTPVPVPAPVPVVAPAEAPVEVEPPAAPEAAPVEAEEPAAEDETAPAEDAAEARTCHVCGNQATAEDRFCRQCGAKLMQPKRFCVRCGQQVGGYDLFCFACGYKLP